MYSINEGGGSQSWIKNRERARARARTRFNFVLSLSTASLDSLA